MAARPAMATIMCSTVASVQPIEAQNPARKPPPRAEDSV
jgi:hypothetical protein